MIWISSHLSRMLGWLVDRWPLQCTDTCTFVELTVIPQILEIWEFESCIRCLVSHTLYPIFQGSIRVDGYDSFGVERDTTPFLEEAEEIRTGPSNGWVWSFHLDIIYYFLPLPLLHSLKLGFALLFYLRHISVSLLHISFEHYFTFYNCTTAVLNCVDIRWYSKSID